MYHIKQDKRSQASAAEIVRGLQECLKTMPLKAITVTDNHRVTGISRATFYRLFDNTEDVLHCQLDWMLEENNRRFTGEETFHPQRMLEEAIALGFSRYEFLKALVDNGRFDLLYDYTEKSFRSLDAVYPIFLVDMEAIEREYVISHLSMAMVTTLITWARNGRKETAADVVRYLKHYIQLMSGLIGED